MLRAIILQYLQKTKEPNLKKWQKNLILGPILAHLAQIWASKHMINRVRIKQIAIVNRDTNFIFCCLSKLL